MERSVEAGRWRVWELCCVGLLLDVGKCFPGDWVVVDALSFGAGVQVSVD